MTAPQPSRLSVARNIKIGFFHLGSGIADVLATGVWNRVMVADLGYSATLVGLLTGLRYFLAPLGIWAGRYSDTHAIGGYRRLFWIWLGRAMMALSTVGLGFATAELVRLAAAGKAQQVSPALWLALALAFLLFSLGNALSGSVFLALIHDRAAPNERGRAVGLVWTMLLLGFTVGGVFTSVLLPHDESAGAIAFTADALLNLFVVSAAVLALLWLVSLLGEEKRHSLPSRRDHADSMDMIGDLALVWRQRRMRYFLFFLTLSMLFAFLQDTVLEPFAGQIFGMGAHITNRFSAYWGSMAILGSLGCLALSRRFPRFTNESLAVGGVWLLIATYALFTLSSLGQVRGLVTPGLIMLGFGLGMWNIGTLGLMMDLSPDGRAGTFLGFWTLCVTIARGMGVAGGGILRDLALAITGEHAAAYAAVFAAGCLGLLISWLALRAANLRQTRPGGQDVEVALASSMD